MPCCSRKEGYPEFAPRCTASTRSDISILFVHWFITCREMLLWIPVTIWTYRSCFLSILCICCRLVVVFGRAKMDISVLEADSISAACGATSVISIITCRHVLRQMSWYRFCPYHYLQGALHDQAHTEDPTRLQLPDSYEIRSATTALMLNCFLYHL